MKRLGAGDRRAFDALYERHGGPVMRFLYRLAGDRALAEDLTQETFLRVWAAAPRWRPTGRVRTWIFQIGKRLAWKQAARRRTRRARAARAAAARPPATTPEPGSPLEAREEAAAVEAAVAGLSPRLRLVFVLVRLEGCSYAETARIAGLRLGTVKSRMAAAEAWLRRRLQEP